MDSTPAQTVGPREACTRLEAPGLPTDGVRVLERHPEGVKGLRGYVWLDMPGKVRSVDPQLLEFTETPAT
jgi:hypothetical protein